ncbi:hypothetical protein EDC94DRAFT_698163 [Helicostylum pulchrum]|nr:hypothetical protein EDC94DRAFT_698163 [Helicostylum pulchrum]
MIWTDIQQSMYTTHNFFNNNITDNDNNTSLANDTIQPTTLKRQSLINSNSYNSTRTDSMSSSTEEDDYSATSRHTNLKRKASMDNNESEDNTDEKRKNFLERNRQAALKCRQRKKQWLKSLQERVEYLSNDNEQLQLQANVMRDEVLSLRSLLMVHKDCHINTNNPMLVQQRHLPIQQSTQRNNIVSAPTTKMI